MLKGPLDRLHLGIKLTSEARPTRVLSPHGVRLQSLCKS